MFILRSFFRHVSNVTHQQALYDMIADVLHIKDLKEDLFIELEALGTITEIEENKKKEEQRGKEEKREKKELERKEQNADTFLAYTTIFVVVSALFSSWSFIDSVFGERTVSILGIDFIRVDIGVFILTSIVFATLGAIGYRHVKKKWGSNLGFISCELQMLDFRT
ncbi:MAG: hypothetical protein LRY73_12495 [Bacillus sp. (in: Bacteria)]|nr:hypothetical protein [Bacillus sp. (in: firmicutes)]